MQLSMVGNEVGSGQVAYPAFQERMDAVIGLLNRTMRRLMGEMYQRAGLGSYQSRPFTPLIASPRHGSFAVTIEMAQKVGTTSSFLATGEEVIEQVISGMKLVESQELDKLRNQIGDEKYFINFVSLAQRLAPDGERVKMVGLTSPRSEVSLLTNKIDIALPIPTADENRTGPSSEVYRGVLDLASARGADRIGLTTENGQRMSLLVQEGMDDMVRSYFNRNVAVVVRFIGDAYLLLEITEVEEQE